MYREVVLIVGDRELAKMKRDDIPPEGRLIHVGDTAFGKSTLYRVTRVVEHYGSSDAHPSVTAQAAGRAFDLVPGVVHVHIEEAPERP